MNPLCLAQTCAAALALAGIASGETPGTSATDADAAGRAASSDLEAFVDQALKTGVLSPAGGSDRAAARQPALGAPPASATCSGVNLLDFEPYSAIERYGDLMTFKAAAADAGESGEADRVRQEAMAHLALGLGAEAIALVSDDADPAADLVRALGHLIETGQGGASTAFQDSAPCHAEADMWLAVARLLNGDRDAAPAFERRLPEFRRLPFRLRAIVAAWLAPPLLRANEAGLVDKTLADFARSDARNVSVLNFAFALRDLGRGVAGAEIDVQNHLLDPAYQDDALKALRAKNAPIDPLRRTMLFDPSAIGALAAQGDQLSEAFRYALEDLSARSRYPELLDLLEASGPDAGPDAQMVLSVLEASLRRDLESGSPQRRLAALNVVVNTAQDLSELADLQPAAAVVAAAFGLRSLAAALADASTEASLLRAELAFRRGDFASVYEAASSQDGNARLNLLAARAALLDGDAFYYGVFEARVVLDNDAVRTLVLDDASLGRWMVGDFVYALAQRLSRQGDDQALQDALALKNATAPETRQTPVPRAASAPSTLARARVFLGRLEEETG